MNTQEVQYQARKASIARWFSKDSDSISIFYAKNGKAYPVTRDEQDRWLAIGYELARRAVYPSYSADPSTVDEQERWLALEYDLARSATTLQSVALERVRHLGLAVFAVFSFFVLPQWLSYPLAMAGPVAGMACALYVIVALAHKEQSADKAIQNLRGHIEQKLSWRNPIKSAPKRSNAFRITALAGAALIFATSMFCAIVRPNDTLVAKIILAEIGLIVFIALTSQIAVWVDGANIRQTGKWFRWLGRR